MRRLTRQFVQLSAFPFRFHLHRGLFQAIQHHLGSRAGFARGADTALAQVNQRLPRGGPPTWRMGDLGTV
ncbi:MAG: hypothetical protein IPN71_16215 [Fibrobacteres bacterium]|nr:hypothetical protein [Fibrobacterota bacterium]